MAESGHSKWDNIKHKKAANDKAKAANAFKMSSKITVLAKVGGADPAKNLRLAYAMEKAKSMSIPKRVIESAVKRGSGELKSGAAMESVVYEGMGPGHTSVVVEAITDNKNRTVAKVRGVFNKHNLKMNPTLYMFDKKGLLLLELGEVSFDDAFEDLIELGVEDIEEVGDGLIEVLTDPNDFGKVSNQIKDDKKYKIKEMEIGYVPKEDMSTTIDNPETKESYDRFLEAMEELDDVEQVYTNLRED